MADFAYSKLPVYVRRREDQGVYEFGVVMDKVFVVFGVRKFGGVDADILAANPPAPAAEPSDDE